jgi:hypothetical protein
MPLDPLQERIARTALALPEARTLALAGGGAMIVHGFVARQTKDIDLFTEIDDAEAVRSPQRCAGHWRSRSWARERGIGFLDVHALLARYGPDRLLELAAAKDSGFSTATFIDALRAMARLGPADWAEDGIDPDTAHRLTAAFTAWRHQLAGTPAG